MGIWTRPGDRQEDLRQTGNNRDPVERRSTHDYSFKVKVTFKKINKEKLIPRIDRERGTCHRRRLGTRRR